MKNDLPPSCYFWNCWTINCESKLHGLIKRVSWNGLRLAVDQPLFSFGISETCQPRWSTNNCLRSRLQSHCLLWKLVSRSHTWSVQAVSNDAGRWHYLDSKWLGHGVCSGSHLPERRDSASYQARVWYPWYVYTCKRCPGRISSFSDRAVRRS